MERSRRSVAAWWWMLASLAVAGCDCGGGEAPAGAACTGEEAPVACGRSCAADADCGSGAYCLDGRCAADCVPGRVACAAGWRCEAARGRCVEADGGPVGRPDGAPGDGLDCPSVDVTLRRKQPYVVLIVDQSGSMDDTFADGESRWVVLRRALIGPGGLVEEMQSIVRFGLALYTGRDESETCPEMTFVDPALDNLGAISSVYGAASPVEDTPTGDAIDAVLARFAPVIGDPDRTDPVVFVLATDGEPDRCEQLDPNPTPEAQAEAVAAVRRAYEQGVATYLIDVGNGVGPAHKQDVANAGVGVGPGDPPAPYWTVTEDRGLREALWSIVGGALDCVLELDGTLSDLDEACARGEVFLDGEALACGDPDGWRVVDRERIELLGGACERFRSSAAVRVQARFGCGIVLL